MKNHIANIKNLPASIADVLQDIKLLPEIKKRTDIGFVIEAIHEYTDESGNNVFYRVRLKHPDSLEKWIRPLHYKDNKWIFQEPMISGLKPLYKLQNIVEKPDARVWICEGEWATDHLNRFFEEQNLRNTNIATTSGGAGTANQADWSPIIGHEIVIWPDNDPAGAKYSDAVATKLKDMNCDYKMVDIARLNLPSKGDVVDWLEINKQANFNDIDDLPFEDDSEEQPKSLSKFMLPAKKLMKLILPELEYVVYPFISTQSLSMVYAKRGIGKTWFSMQLAVSVALGKPFFAWEVPCQRRVLYIDGEMPLGTLQYRLNLLLSNEIPEYLNILSSEILWREGHSLNLNNPEDLEAIDTFLSELELVNERPELIIIDNLSSMSAGVDENGNSEMENLLRWLLKLRSQGYAVMLVHHAGKNGDQRGGSRREDFLDTSIKLNEVKDSFAEVNSGGANFIIEFLKIRGIRPNPYRLQVGLDTDDKGNAKWRSEGAEIHPAYFDSLKVIRDCAPSSQADIAKTLCISASAVSQQLKVAREKGYLEKKSLTLTKKGKAELNKYFTDTAELGLM